MHMLFEIFQFLIIATLVTGCAVYCLLTLTPRAFKLALKQALLRCPIPGFVATWLQQGGATGGCGSNCGSCPSSKATPQPVKWLPRKL